MTKNLSTKNLPNFAYQNFVKKFLPLNYIRYKLWDAHYMHAIMLIKKASKKFPAKKSLCELLFSKHCMGHRRNFNGGIYGLSHNMNEWLLNSPSKVHSRGHWKCGSGLFFRGPFCRGRPLYWYVGHFDKHRGQQGAKNPPFWGMCWAQNAARLAHRRAGRGRAGATRAGSRGKRKSSYENGVRGPNRARPAEGRATGLPGAHWVPGDPPPEFWRGPSLPFHTVSDII